MTQTSKPEIAAADVTAAQLASNSEFVVITPSGRRIGEMPSLAFGLGSWEGDCEGFAAWLRAQA
jgi:hypothetical protein